MYPAGRVYRRYLEDLGGNSAVETILREASDDRQVAAAGLSPLHNIRRVMKLEQLPVLGTGKTDYRALREML